MIIKPNNRSQYQASLCIEKYQKFELIDSVIILEYRLERLYLTQ